MATPRPGQPVRGSSTGRPIMAALDLLGRRTALRIIWELRQPQPLTFRALQQACDTNARLLNTRLKELRESGLVEHAEGGYRLTEHGRRLRTALQPFAAWADRWAPAAAAPVSAPDARGPAAAPAPARPRGARSSARDGPPS